MKLKSILLSAIATLGLTTATIAQVPNYVPTNGLVGWWPFNGNAIEFNTSATPSTNTASLTPDRFSNANNAYSFNGNSMIKYLGSNPLSTIGNSTQNWTFNFWVKASNSSGGNILGSFGWGYMLYLSNTNNLKFDFINSSLNWSTYTSLSSLSINNWHMITITRSNGTIQMFINNILDNTFASTPNIAAYGEFNSWFGANGQDNNGFFSGAIDDIGIWSRALTQQEITSLYNAVSCASNTNITPITNSLSTGSTATFTASTSDPNPSYVWQSNFGQGFQTLNNFGNYSGANSSTLNIANVQLSEQNQPIRVITTSGNCIDTSNVAVINILDTCFVTVYDTLYTTVTDTLIINATLTGLNPPSNLNTLKVYPNPANTHITIDYGNFVSMNGYTLKIVNAVGQTVFTTPINQQTSYIDLSTWTGNGIYFVQLIDPQNNTVENRKIVIQ